MKFIDLTGKRFGRLLVLNMERDDNNRKCNIAKASMPEKEFKEWIVKVYKNYAGKEIENDK